MIFYISSGEALEFIEGNEEGDEDEDFRLKHIMGMKRKKMNNFNFSDTTMDLLVRKRELCNIIQYVKPTPKTTFIKK